MKEKWTEQEKRYLVARYRGGEPVKALCAEIGVSKSSFYEWIALYRETETRTGQIMTPREFEFLRRRVEKLEELVAIFQQVGCTPSAPLQEKLREMEKLHGQFSVHVLCEALDVPRGTFYNHLYRNKRGSTTYASAARSCWCRSERFSTSAASFSVQEKSVPCSWHEDRR